MLYLFLGQLKARQQVCEKQWIGNQVSEAWKCLVVIHESPVSKLQQLNARITLIWHVHIKVVKFFQVTQIINTLANVKKMPWRLKKSKKNQHNKYA